MGLALAAKTQQLPPSWKHPGEVSWGAVAESAITNYTGWPASHPKHWECRCHSRATHQQGSGRKRTSQRRWPTLQASVGRALRWPRPGLTTQFPAAAPQQQSSSMPAQVAEAARCQIGCMTPRTCSMLIEATDCTCPSTAAQGQFASLLCWVFQALPCQEGSRSTQPRLQARGPVACLMDWGAVMLPLHFATSQVHAAWRAGTLQHDCETCQVPSPGRTSTNAGSHALCTSGDKCTQRSSPSLQLCGMN